MSQEQNSPPEELNHNQQVNDNSVTEGASDEDGLSLDSGAYYSTKRASGYEPFSSSNLLVVPSKQMEPNAELSATSGSPVRRTQSMESTSSDTETYYKATHRPLSTQDRIDFLRSLGREEDLIPHDEGSQTIPTGSVDRIIFKQSNEQPASDRTSTTSGESEGSTDSEGVSLSTALKVIGRHLDGELRPLHESMAKMAGGRAIETVALMVVKSSLKSGQEEQVFSVETNTESHSKLT